MININHNPPISAVFLFSCLLHSFNRFFFNDPPTTEIYTLSLHDALPIYIVPVESALRPEERSARYRHNGAVIWLTGLPGSGKSTLARALERRLFGNGGSPILLDGDTLRAGLNSDLGFSAQDRTENIRRLAEVATHLARNGHIAVVAAVSDRKRTRL